MDDDDVTAAVGALLAVLALGVLAGAVSGPLVGSNEREEIGDATGENYSGDLEPPDGGGCLVGCGAGIRAQIGTLLSSVPAPVLAAVAAVAVGVVAYALRGDDSPTEPVEDDGPAPTESVATRPETAGFEMPDEPAADNDVYRAWRDLADRVEADRSATPREYARLAARRYDEADVETLTELFRRVRYGDAEATEDREDRARRALDDIREGAGEP